MRAKTMQANTFEELYDIAPTEIKDYIDRCENTPQSKEWHPEGNVKIHTKIVFNRAKRTDDINLMLAAFFHDLGKADTTVKHPTIPNKWSTITHENISAKLVVKYQDWIESLGGEISLIYYLVKNHMRAKEVDKMRKHKRDEIYQHPWYHYMKQFTEFDDMRKNYYYDTDE